MRLLLVSFLVFATPIMALEEWQLPPQFAEVGMHAACASYMPGAVVACPEHEVEGRKCNFEILGEIFKAHPYQHCVKKICGKDGENRRFRKYDFGKNAQEVEAKVKNTIGVYAKEYAETLLASARKGIEIQKENKRFRKRLVFDKTMEGERTRFRNSLAGVITKFPIAGEEKKALRERVHPDMDEELFNTKVQYQNEFFRLKKRVYDVDPEKMITSLKSKDGQLKAVKELLSRVGKLPDHFSKKEPLLQNLYKIQAFLIAKEDAGYDSHGADIINAMELRIGMEEQRAKRRSLRRLERKIFNHKDIDKKGYEFLEKEINGDLYKSFSESFSNSCVEKIARNAASLATEENVEKLKNNIKKTRENIIAKLGDYYSSETSKNLATHLRSVRVNIPPSREKFLREMELALKEKTDRLKSYKEDKRALTSLHLMNERSSLMGVNQDCFSEMIPIASAFVVTGHNYLNHKRKIRKEGEKNLLEGIHVLSLSTGECHDYHTEGKGTIAHEMGHLVGMYISDVGSKESKWAHYENVMCVRGNKFKDDLEYEKAISDRNPAALGRYQEEDFADAFGATFAPTENNQWCSKFYQEENVRRYDWKITDELRSHSTAAYRLLTVEAHKGNPIPQICLDEMKGRGQEKQFKNCFVPKN